MKLSEIVNFDFLENEKSFKHLKKIKNIFPSFAKALFLT